MSMSIIFWIIVGIVAGWLAEKIMGRNHGLLTNLVVGIVGAVLGGWIAGALGFAWGGWIGSTIVATLGACLLLFLLGLVKRRA
ncbi:MAG: GlsB/YeaQ/YmgE family stress response membrane protein [Caulobacteraceae bacterium]|nr:GlsB/YeaQ/YmgE family stress response membrane protein [Caulobacteraceae bacterium]